MSLRQQLGGTGVALVTPFTPDGRVDFDALGRVIDQVVEGGVEYLVSLGTTGETPTLDTEEKKDILAYTYDKAANRLPVVVGIGGNDTAALEKDLQQFPLSRATAVLSAAPYYSKPSQEGLFQHYKALAAASPLPLLLYNIPGRTGRNMNAETTLRLAHEVNNIAGIKEASGDLAQCMQLVKEAPEDFLVVSGDDALALPQIACGMSGVISVIANTLPRQFSDMVRLCLQNDFVAARSLHHQLLPAYELLFTENNPAGVKAFMAQQGLLHNQLRLPVTPVSDALYKKIHQYLAALTETVA